MLIVVFSAETNSTLFDLPNPISPAAAFLNGRNSLPSDGAFLEAVCRLCGNRALKNRKKFIGKDTPKKLLSRCAWKTICQSSRPVRSREVSSFFARKCIADRNWLAFSQFSLRGVKIVRKCHLSSSKDRSKGDLPKSNFIAKGQRRAREAPARDLRACVGRCVARPHDSAVSGVERIQDSGRAKCV